MIKSFLFLRFLILYFVVRFLVSKEIIDYKLLFFVYGLCAFFVSFDLIIQYTFGKNLFGMEGADGRRLSGVFGDEYIAGGFIQKFFIFLPYSVLFFSRITNRFFLHFLLLFIFAITLLGVLASGNRMPLLFTIFTLSLIFIYEKKLRKLIGVSSIIFLLIFSFLFKTNDRTYNHFNAFKQKSFEFVSYFHESLSTSERVLPKNVYVKEFVSGILTWEQNKVFGGGVKSFFLNCESVEKDIKKVYIGSCNTHPHNYYLEIATSLGIIGLFFSIIIFSIILIKSVTFTLYSNVVPEIKNIFGSKSSEESVKNKNSIEIIVSCGEDSNLEKYINEGWTIKTEYFEEKVCSWKTVAASKDCDMEKDKGCKIVQPDKIGEERIYLLEK